MGSGVQHALEQLKTTGVRITPQRHAILTYLMEAMNHPTADDIYRALEPQFPSMSVATVYNNLKMFMEAGMVRELTYGDNSSRFDANVSDHYHVICQECGKIEDFSYPSLHEVEQRAEQDTGFKIHGLRMELYGVCKCCSEKQH
ncbi:peroxide-responsive transcriptional repressor PerR [Paenibacillus sp. BAC0078]